MVKESRRPKPSTVDVSEELGFTKQRLPEVGPGMHKPNMGRGGVALTNEYYFPESDLKVTEKKGEGIGEQVKQKKTTDTNKPKWSEVV
jgi:hypothetical protein